MRDPEKAKAYNARYREAHREELRQAAAKLWKTPERREYMQQYYKANRDRILAYHKDYSKKHSKRDRLRSYGMTIDQYDQMVLAQDGRCAICGRIPTYELVVDHDHETGFVRGLLCQGCNAGIGYLGDDIEALERALAYLRVSCDLYNDGRGRGTHELTIMAPKHVGGTP